LAMGLMAQEQKAYEIPYGSKENEIEISVVNTSSIASDEIKVELINPPSWIRCKTKTVTIPKLEAKSEQGAAFLFDVEKTTEVNKEQVLTFHVIGKNNQRWTKEIKIKVLAPETFELFQNYPNPFNPTTVISYQLSTVCQVTLKIYDILGKEVATLVNEQKEPGGYEEAWDASRYSSGVYIYRLVVTDGNASARSASVRHVFTKKMVVMK
jgi:hypothetical protein